MIDTTRLVSDDSRTDDKTGDDKKQIDVTNIVMYIIPRGRTGEKQEDLQIPEGNHHALLKCLMTFTHCSRR
jgi:hypothetical protein